MDQDGMRAMQKIHRIQEAVCGKLAISVES